jgi:hypothetical protein
MPDEGLGIAGIGFQHFKATVTGHVGDLEQVRATLDRARDEASAQAVPGKGRGVEPKLGGGGLGPWSGGPRVGRLSETGSDNDDSVGQSGDEHLHDTSPSIVHQRRRRRHQPFCTLSESRSGKGGLIPD